MWLYRMTGILGPLLARPYWRVGMTGSVEMIPSKGSLLLVSNHASFLDPWFIGFAFPRPVRYLINREWYDRSPLWRSFLRAYGAVPVVPKDPDATFAMVCEVLAAGDVVGIFPEGAISPDGHLRRFRSGVSVIAAKSGAPVLPVGLRGNFDALPRHRWVPLPRRVTLHVGNPVHFPGAPVQGAVSREAAIRFRGHLFQEVSRLSGQHEPSPLGRVVTQGSPR
jgi:1-acyl-sn-glycerol-3-phosphate acyltransferase